jgi:hypothetical protein
MPIKKNQVSKVFMTVEKGWIVFRIEAPFALIIKVMLAMVSIIATIYGYPALVEVVVKLLTMLK